MRRSKDLVAAAALAGAFALGGFLYLRAHGFLGTHWTDGARAFASESEVGVRHAVWDAPERLAELGEAADPAVSPDGRWLVFASGARGLNCELYVAELVDGAPRTPRPLAALDSPADELAPAFGDGWLYFASDRAGGAGGLDLWRARYEDGEFGRVEALPPGLNSAADETDPAPEPGTRTLVFASNRARADLDLYAATPDGEDFYAVTPLDALDGPSAEQGPAFASDGRSLYFASDRAGGAGGFDLYRALRFADGWQTPTRVAELSGERGERAPSVASDGFALFFERTDEDGAPALERARSLEIFRVPPPGVTLAQWLTLAALVLLALLAQLAKRWRALDILYKCFLVSLLLHLLLMLYLRTVVPAHKSYERGPGEGSSYRVRLVPAEPAPESGIARASADDGGAAATLAFQRLESQAPPAAAPAPLALTAPPRSAEPAPAREESALEPSLATQPPPALAGPLDDAPRYDGQAPELTLAAHADTARLEAQPGPAHAQPGERALPAPLPDAAHVEASEASAGDVAHGAERTALAPQTTTNAPAISVLTPHEALARDAGRAPALALEPAATSPDARAAAEPAHEHFEAAPVAAAAPRARPGEGATAAGETNAPPSAPGPAPLAASAFSQERAGEAEASPALRAPNAEAAPAATQPARAFDATAGLAEAPQSLPHDAPSGGPAHAASRSAPSAPRALPASGAALVGTLAGVPSEAAAPAIEHLHAQPAPDASVASSAPELRAPAVERAPTHAAASAAPRFDALAGLGVARAAPPATPAAPERASPAPARDLPAPAPRAPALEAVPAPELAPPPERENLPRVAETPYQNRFGEQKLRALEEFGGTPESEHAVAAGLAYLARIQGESGAWGQRSDAHPKYLDVRIGKSALALLAFLGAGHVPGGDSEHAAVAARAVRYLVGTQDAATGHFGRSCSYGHGIATYALAECYALTHDAALRAPLERAVAEILAHQSGDSDPRRFGGWGYYFADGHVWQDDDWPRTSVSSWQVMALESARLGGLAVPDEAFANAREFLANTWDARRGAFRYDHDPERLSSGYPILPASTPAALFALSLLGVDPGADELAPARRFVLTRAPDGYRWGGEDDFVRQARGNLYFWYYATLAMFRVGGREWEHWNAALQTTLLPAQDDDGSWRPIDVYSEYAGDDDDERTYSTAMCVLSLEIYYRYFTPLLKVK